MVWGAINLKDEYCKLVWIDGKLNSDRYIDMIDMYFK